LGISNLDQVFESWVREAFAPYADKVKFTYKTDLTLEEFQERLAHLPPQSIIFFTTFTRDPTGREFLSREAVNLMGKAANAPIYDFYDTLLNSGIVGGSLLLNAMEAMKQAATASPEIHLKTGQRSPDYITVSLKDNGKGLPADELEKIFEPFWTSKAEGLGLGLSISRSIISAHGGRLWAQANADKGVTFLFTLPHNQGESDEPHTGHGLRSG
jgi:hypothetical protein